jgi:hypothetical protein
LRNSNNLAIGKNSLKVEKTTMWMVLADRSHALGQLLNSPDPVKTQRVTQAMPQMTKVDNEKLYQARG